MNQNGSNDLAKLASSPSSLAVNGANVSTLQIGSEKKVYIVRGNKRIPAFIIPTDRKINQPKQAENGIKEGIQTSSNEVDQLKTVKEEPIEQEEETSGAIANITESNPINLQDLLKTSFPTSSKMCYPSSSRQDPSGEHFQSMRNRQSYESANINNGFALNRNTQEYTNETTASKRTRKPTKNDDYVYNSDFQDETEEYNSGCSSAKKNRTVDLNAGCRCEYIVPELEHKMDRVLEKMQFIEILAKSLLAKETSHVVEKETELNNAQQEIQQLRRQLIMQRNQKSLQLPEN